MNEEAIQDSYDVFVSQGYTKSIDEYKKLIATNPEALNDSYKAFASQGYNKSIDDYKKLMGLGVQPKVATVKKKDIGESNMPIPQQNITVSSSAVGSSATQKPKTSEVTPITKSGMPLAVPAFFSEAAKTTFELADNAIISARKILQEQGFFDDDIPDTDTPISDAMKNKIVAKKGEILNLPNAGKPQSDGGPLDLTPLIGESARLGLKIINSTLPQDKKNVIIAALNLGDAALKRNIRGINKVQAGALPKDNLLVNAGKGIVGMAPDLVAAEVIGTPAAAEGRIARYVNEVTKDAKPLIQKYLPKAAKFVEEAVRAPFTKIMAGKGILSGVANAKEGEDIVEAGIQGGLEGGKEGVIMHGLGVVSGKVMPKIAKQISRTGVNSTIATGIANPLANAGVFTTAKAIRKGIEEQKLITPEEAAMEAATGVGFSLLHAGSLAKNHNELNHYADNVLKTDEVESLKRVVNETKDNLDLVYNPDLTTEDISKLEEVRNEMKSAVLKEPDLNNKQLLINEALKIQNQLDAHSAINNIVENKDAIVNEINSSPDTSEDVKDFFTKKIQAIADHFDNSEYGLKKKELNAKIEIVQKQLDDASLAFTNRKSASDGIEANLEIEKRRAELDGLNNELTELVTNKINENAVQEPTTNESVLRTEQPQLELQGVGEGNAQPEGVAQEETIITEKPEEVAEPLKNIESTTNTLNEIGGENDLKNELAKKIDDKIELLRDENGEISDADLPEFKALKNAKESINRGVVTTPEAATMSGRNSEISEAYHIAKVDGSNPELVKAVEELLAPKVEATPVELAPAEDASFEPMSEEDLKGYEEAVKQGDVDESLISELDKESMDEVYRQRDAEIELYRTTTPGFGDKLMFLHENLGRIRPSDFDSYGDANQRKGNKGFAIKYLSDKATPLDTRLAELSDLFGSEITPDDAIEYILDREANPEKYKRSKEKIRKLNNAAKIMFSPEKAYEVYMSLRNDAKSMAALDALAGKVLSDEQVKIIKNHLKQKYGETNPTTNRGLQRANETSKGIEADNAIKTLQESKEYAEADDIQKENLVRKVRKDLGLKEKSAPSVNRLFGKLKDIAKVTMTEKAGLVKQIKDLAKGARIAKVAIKNATQDLAAQVAELQKGGKITTAQEKTIMNKFSKVNVLSETSVRRFTDYMTKVFNNAEYANELSNANKTKIKISKLSKSKEKNANLRELGKKFIQIDPSMVDDIYTYNETAKSIEDAIRGSSVKGFKETVKIAEVNDYIDKLIESQNNKIEQDRIAESEDLLGLTEEEVNDILEGKKVLEKEKEDELKEKVKTQFDIYSDQIKKAIETGKNPITDEDISYSREDKDIIEKFMAMDLSLLDIKEAIAASDSLNNFIVNESTANMENVLSKYTGKYEAENFKGVAKEIKKLWSKPGGRIITEGGTPMGEVFTKLFKGATAGDKFGKASGMNKIVNGKAIAISKINAITKDYIDRFYKKKANGEAFNTAYNDVERGIVSDLRRHLVGDEQQIQKEFDRRVGILDQSIKRLKEGTEKEKEKAKLYEKVYDKIVKDSKSIEDVENKTDKVNLDAVKFWQETHEKTWDDISRYMLNVHNTILEKGVNYSSPDKYVKLSTEETSTPLQDSEAMYGRNGDYLYKKEASGFMKAEFPEKLPEGRYRDYSFDQNNVNSMHDALVDLNTGAAVRQLEAFRKSEGFKRIIPSVEDRNLVNRRFKLYVENLRNKGNTYGAEDLKPVIKVLDRIGTIGVGLALGSPTQMGKQTVPILFNTLANAGRANLGAPFDPKFIDWLNKSGYAIGNRGAESQAQIESLNKKIEIASKKGVIPLSKAVKAAQKFWLREFLVRGDVYIAKASWQTYYEKALRKQGESTKNIDYSDHKINKDAADYAEMMTQRQQNVNDPDLGGSWFTSNRTERKMLGKILLNFANFRMSQSSRLAADLSTLGHWSTATAEDRAIAARSLGGYALESLAYRLMSVGIAIGIGNIAQAIRGVDESDKDKKERISKLFKSARSGAATDFFSPAPFLDFAVKPLTAYTTEAIEKQTGLPLSTYGTTKQTFIESLGGYGIPFSRAYEIWNVLSLANSGTYEDDYGKEKKIATEDQETIQTLAPLAVLSALGVLPTDIGTGVRDVVKYSKKKPQTLENKLLGNFKNQEEMKLKDPETYEENFGKNSEYKQYLDEQKEGKDEKKQNEKEIKEEMD
jgi:hypothetical protein